MVNLGTATLTGQTNSGGSLYLSDPTGLGLNNGTIYDGGNRSQTENGRTYCPANSSSITFDLDLTSQPGGYDIGSIASVSGGSQARRSQKFRLEVSTVGDPGFVVVASETDVDYVTNAGSGEARVMIYDDAGAPLATGVDQVRVTYFNTGGTYPETMYRELDIYSYDPVGNVIPPATSAAKTAHFDASDLHGDGGHANPADGTDVGTWTDLVSRNTLNHNLTTDGQPTYIASAIGGAPAVRSEATAAGGDLMYRNDSGGDMRPQAQTVFAVVTMKDNGTSLSTLLCDQNHDQSIRQTTSVTAAYFSGNADDFVINDSTAANGGTFHINGERRLDIPGGFDTPHVVKVERNTPATYVGMRISDNIVANRRWNGDVAEIIVFDSKLSGDDTLRVQNYLSAKYGIPFKTALDERITEAKQIARNPFNDGSDRVLAVNFRYSGPTAGTFEGIGFDNIDLAAGGALTGTFPLTANPRLAGATVTLDLPFTSDNSPRGQNAQITGTDAGTLNTVFNEFFYIGGPAHPSAGMLFEGLAPNEDVFVQVLGGDGNWVSDVQVLINGSQTADWLGAADNGSTTGTASLFGFYAKTNGSGELDLEFTVSDGNYAGIGGVVMTQQVPEPATLALAALALTGLGTYVRRRRVP